MKLKNKILAVAVVAVAGVNVWNTADEINAKYVSHLTLENIADAQYSDNGEPIIMNGDFVQFGDVIMCTHHNGRCEGCKDKDQSDCKVTYEGVEYTGRGPHYPED